MSELLHHAHRPAADAGFPDAPPGWTREKAAAIARDEGLDLGDDHWEAVRALQGLFARAERARAREIHDALEEHFHARGGVRYAYELFPGGPVAQGCRIAGLEPPPGAQDPSFGSVQ